MAKIKYKLLTSMLCLISCSLWSQNNAIDLYEVTQAGDATYFFESPNGNCTISPTLPLWGEQLDYQAALSPTQYASGDASAGCGTCLQATYLGTGSGLTPPPDNFTVLVVDQCPGCEAGDLDLAENGSDGRWDITWQATDCPVGETDLAYLLQGSNPFYIKLGIRNHRIAVKAVQIKSQSSASYITATRTSDNFFTCSACPKPLEFPMPVRIIGVNNQVIDDAVPSLTNDVLLSGTGQQLLSINDLIFIDGFNPVFLD